jgi:hypothetical protein
LRGRLGARRDHISSFSVHFGRPRMISTRCVSVHVRSQLAFVCSQLLFVRARSIFVGRDAVLDRRVSGFWSRALVLAVQLPFSSAPCTRSVDARIFVTVHSIFSADASSIPDDAAKIFCGAIRISGSTPRVLFLASIFLPLASPFSLRRSAFALPPPAPRPRAPSSR